MKFVKTLILLIFMYSTPVISLDSYYIYHDKPVSEGLSKMFRDVKEFDTNFIFSYVRDLLPRFLQSCILSNCVTGDNLILLKKIEALASSNPHSGAIYVANSKGEFQPKLSASHRRYVESFGFPLNEKLFFSPDSALHRLAISSTKPGPIIINADKLKNITIQDAFKIIVHEFGHQLGIKDDSHRVLDVLASEVGRFLEVNLKTKKYKNLTITNHFYLLPGTIPVYTTPENSSSTQELPFELYPHLFLQDGISVLPLSHIVKDLILKFPDYLVTSVWFQALNIIEETSDTILIKGRVGHTLAHHTKKEESVSLEGDIYIRVPIKKLQDKIYFDLTKDISLSIADMNGYNNKNEVPSIVSSVIPKEHFAGEKLNFDIILNIPKGKEFRQALAHFKSMDSLKLRRENALAPEKITQITERQYKLSFIKEIDKSYSMPFFEFTKISLIISNSLSTFYLVPKFQLRSKILNRAAYSPLVLRSAALSGTRYGETYNVQSSEIFKLTDFTKDFSSWIDLEVVLAKSASTIEKGFILLIEESKGIPYKFITRAYESSRIISKRSLREINQNENLLSVRIHHHALDQTKEFFRVRGIQLMTHSDDVNTLFFH